MFYTFYTLDELLVERRYALFVLDRHILRLTLIIYFIEESLYADS